jgi:hypothetical protein
MFSLCQFLNGCIWFLGLLCFGLQEQLLCRKSKIRRDFRRFAAEVTANFAWVLVKRSED